MPLICLLAPFWTNHEQRVDKSARNLRTKGHNKEGEFMAILDQVIDFLTARWIFARLYWDTSDDGMFRRLSHCERGSGEKQEYLPQSKVEL